MKTNRKTKKLDSPSKLVLQEVIGLNARNASGLASSTCSSKCFYLAGCVVVAYNVDSGTQFHFLVSHRRPRPLSCVSVSQDGRFVAAGESGNLSAAIVWDCDTMGLLSELKGHLCGVECTAFSPDGKYLLSVGGNICIWDWRRRIMVAKHKTSSAPSAITSMCFSDDGKFIVMAGNEHLRFWTVSTLQKPRLKRGEVSLAVHGKPLYLSPHKESSFVSVKPAKWIDDNGRIIEQNLVYALSVAGILCLMNSRLAIRKSVDLKVDKAFALSTSDRLIACACSTGVVQLFYVKKLDYAGTILYSEAKSWHRESQTAGYDKNHGKDIHFGRSPDAIACQFTSTEKLVVIYADHRLYVWDIHDVRKVTRCSMIVSHSACIWDIKSLSCGLMHNPSVACVARGCPGGVSFATCSVDGTIRLWDLSLQNESTEANTECCSLDDTPVGKAVLATAGIFERDLVEAEVSPHGLRSLAISRDGNFLAAGDFEGNLHIYDLKASEYTFLKDAHDAEILSLSFTFPNLTGANSKNFTGEILASGGRDGRIHLYDAKRNFDILGTVEDHSAAVTSVKLPRNGCKILSCSADKTLVFRDVVIADSEARVSLSCPKITSHGKVYDMAMDQILEIVVTVGQDKRINIYDMAAGRLFNSFKPERDFGDPLKVILDPSCNYMACSYSNRTICMFDLRSGELVAQGSGHGEAVTGFIFLPDCKHLVSVGGDGCIFVWKLPSCMASRMLQTVAEHVRALSPKSQIKALNFKHSMPRIGEEQQKVMPSAGNLDGAKNASRSEERSSPWTSSFKFSISRLPKWARAKVTSSDIIALKNHSDSTQKNQALETMADDVGSPEKSESLCLSSTTKITPDTDTTENSTFQHKVMCSGIEKHWHTVYNVCFDMLNSPEILDSKDVANVVSSTVTDTKDIRSSVKCSEVFSDKVGKQAKAEKASQRRRYSSKYILRRDYFGDKRILDDSARHSTDVFLNGIEGCDSEVALGSSEKQQRRLFSTNQDKKSGILLHTNSNQQPSSECYVNDNPSMIEPTEIQQLHHPDDGETRLLAKITACHEALKGLNNAAKHVMQTFSDLSSMDPEGEIFTGAGAKLRNETAELFPSISEGIDAVAKAVHGNDKSQSSRFDQVLQRLTRISEHSSSNYACSGETK